jgi:DNA-binding PadR family transcriptional regulator
MAKNGKNDLQGALDLLILNTLSQLGCMHGYGIMMHIRRVTDELLIVQEGWLLSRIAPHGAERLDAR